MNLKFIKKFSTKLLKDYKKPRDHVITGFSLKKNFRFSFVQNEDSLKASMVL